MATAQAIQAREVALAEYESAKARLNQGPLAVLGNLRQSAIDHFADVGFPTRREEAWRFTDLSALAKTEFHLPPLEDRSEQARAALDRFAYPGLDAIQIVFVNGRVAPTLSAGLSDLPSGVTIGSLRDALAEDPQRVLAHLAQHARIEETPFVALNTALFEDGLHVDIGRGQVVEKPIHVIFITVGEEPMVTSPRMLVALGENAQATVIETHLSEGTGVHFTNAQGEISVAEGANLTHLKIQRESEAAFHIACVKIHQGKDSNVFSNNITLGAALTRNDIGARIDAEGAHCALDGLNMVSGTQHVDNHTLLDHAKPHCTSHQLYKSIIDDRATTVFNGRIVVHQDAQKTDAVQSNHSLLLADTATAHTQPNLEIFADDVKCTHGATVGNIDAGAIFYLRTRGVPEEEARALLTFAFANEIIDEIAIEPIRRTLEDLALARFRRILGEK